MSLERDHTVGRYALRMRVRPGIPDPADTLPRPPLVLANGIGVPLEAFDPFVDALDPAIEVVRFDAPGVGATPTPNLPLPYQVISRALGLALDELGYRRVDMLGISWGGGLAQQFAFQNPRRCRNLVLVATATGSMMIPARPRVLRHMLTPRRHQDPAYARRVAGEIYGGSMRSPDADSPLEATAQGGSSRGLPVPVTRHSGVDEPAVPAADPAADPGAGRVRRSDRPDRQRPDDGAAVAERDAVDLSRRPRRTADAGAGTRPHDRGLLACRRDVGTRTHKLAVTGPTASACVAAPSVG